MAFQIHIPGPPFASVLSLDDAKQSFKWAWLAFKERHGPEKLAAAYAAMNLRKSCDVVGGGRRGAEIRPSFPKARIGGESPTIDVQAIGR